MKLTQPCTRRTPFELPRALSYLAAIAVFVVCMPAATAQAIFIYNGTYDFTNLTAYQVWTSGRGCLPGTCVSLDGSGQVSTSDYAVGQDIGMEKLADGEVVTWKVTLPDGSTQTVDTVTYNQASDCFIVSNGTEYCGGQDNLIFTESVEVNSCQPNFSAAEIGQWTLNSYDGSTLLYSSPFQISRNSSGPHLAP